MSDHNFTIDLVLMVRDAVGTPYPGARVTALNTDVLTDDNGRVSIKLHIEHELKIEFELDILLGGNRPRTVSETYKHVTGLPDSLARVGAGGHVPGKVPIWRDPAGPKSYATVFIAAPPFPLPADRRFPWQNPALRFTMYEKRREPSLISALKLLFDVQASADAGHDALVTLLVKEYVADHGASPQHAPPRYAGWVYYLLFHFSGLRYTARYKAPEIDGLLTSAHGSYAKPAWLLRRLRFLEISRSYGYDATSPLDLDKGFPLFVVGQVPDESAERPDEAGEAHALVELLFPGEQDGKRRALLDLLAGHNIGKASAFLQRELCSRLCGNGSTVFNHAAWRALEQDDFAALAVLQMRLDANFLAAEPVWSWIARLTPARNATSDWGWEHLAQQASNPPLPRGLPTGLGIDWQDLISKWANDDSGTWWRLEHRRSLEPVVSCAVCDQIACIGENARGVFKNGGLAANARDCSATAPLRQLLSSNASEVQPGCHIIYVEWLPVDALKFDVDEIYNLLYWGSSETVSTNELRVDEAFIRKFVPGFGTSFRDKYTPAGLPVCFGYPPEGPQSDDALSTASAKLEAAMDPFASTWLNQPPGKIRTWFAYLRSHPEMCSKLPENQSFLVPLIDSDRGNRRWGQRHMVVKKDEFGQMFALYIYHEALVIGAKSNTFYSFQTAGGGRSITGVEPHLHAGYTADRMILFGAITPESEIKPHPALPAFLPDASGNLPSAPPASPLAPVAAKGPASLTLLFKGLP